MYNGYNNNMSYMYIKYIATYLQLVAYCLPADWTKKAYVAVAVKMLYWKVNPKLWAYAYIASELTLKRKKICSLAYNTCL